MNKKIKNIIACALLTLATTIVLAVVALLNVLLIVNYGPSDIAHKVFVKSVKESSAMGFLGDWFTTKKELEEIMNENAVSVIEDVTNPNLIQIAVKTPTPIPEGDPLPAEVTATPTPIPAESDDPTLASDGNHYEDIQLDEDGIIVVGVSGSTYSGRMMIILDPSRVFVGTCSSIGNASASGERVGTIMERYGAIAATNAGGFEDINGSGTGSLPLGFVFSEGKLINDTGSGLVIGFDENNILIVGNMTTAQAKEKGIRDAVDFGPALIVNGVSAQTTGTSSGLNPRTAIGQRSDGAVLLLTVDGRQASSLGASYGDLITIFEKFGAVNAANLDGGSSTCMYYDGELISNHSNVINDRYLPTAILVK